MEENKKNIWCWRHPKENEHFIKNINDRNFTPDMLLTYHLLSKKWSYRARVSSIYEMLRDAFGMKEFALHDPRTVRQLELQSWLLDRQIEFMNGEDVDFTEIYEALMIASDFIRSERIDFELGNVEERLWGIFWTIIDPFNKTKITDKW